MPLRRGGSPYFPILFPADHDLVRVAPMMGCTNGPAARDVGSSFKKLEVFHAIRCFLGPCSLSFRPEDSQAFDKLLLFLEFDLSDDAWDQVNVEYVSHIWSGRGA